MHTVEEANELWCPMIRVANGTEVSNCAVNEPDLFNASITKLTRCNGDGCMMWRWSTSGAWGERLGFCGLAGKPL